VLNRILFIPVLFSGLTACIDLNSGSGGTNNQDPKGDWVSECIDSTIPGLATELLSEISIADFKVEQLSLNDGSYEKNVDYYSDEECVSFVDRKERFGEYLIEDYRDSVPTGGNSFVLMARIQFKEIVSDTKTRSFLQYYSRSNFEWLKEETGEKGEGSLLTQMVSVGDYYEVQDGYYLELISGK